MKPFEYTHIYIIQSLRLNDAKTGTELFNDVIHRRMMQRGLETQCALLTANSKIEFFNALETIRKAEVFQLAKPIIHFELHGDENGLEINNGETVSWTELQFFLLQLNGICRNNLFVSMATCKGGYIHKAINPSMWAPFWGFMGPIEEVMGEEILANYSSFYDEFLQSGNFNSAVMALHAINPDGYSRFRFHNTEFVFQKAYQNYELLYLTPEMVEQRIGHFFSECRPRQEFNMWSDQMIRDYAKQLIMDEGGFLKKQLMRKFFMLDVFPDDAQYYNGLN